jgi:hypothetical protein
MVSCRNATNAPLPHPATRPDSRQILIAHGHDLQAELPPERSVSAARGWFTKFPAYERLCGRSRAGPGTAARGTRSVRYVTAPGLRRQCRHFLAKLGSERSARGPSGDGGAALDP